jgi:hypothetical protein
MTSSEIEPVTFRLVAYCLSKLRSRQPLYRSIRSEVDFKRLRGPHSGEYEELCFVGYKITQCAESRWNFQEYTQNQCSGLNCKQNVKPVCFLLLPTLLACCSEQQRV